MANFIIYDDLIFIFSYFINLNTQAAHDLNLASGLTKTGCSEITCWTST